jgi:hypothetical protein
LYILTEHLYSDLQFYKDDLKFLYHLVDKYFMGFTHNANLWNENPCQRVVHESKCCDELQDKTALHLKHLAELIDAPYKYDSIK